MNKTNFNPPTEQEIKKILCDYIKYDKNLSDKQYTEMLQYLIYEYSSLEYARLKRQILSLLSEGDAFLRNKFYSILNKTKNESLYTHKNFQYLLLEIIVPNFHQIAVYGGASDKEEITGTAQYPYIRGSMNTFIERVFENKIYLQGKRFIDIGCGIGDKVFMMNFISNMDCNGLEYDYINIKLGKVFSDQIKDLDVHLFCRDAFKYMEFDKYDRIYTYNPLNDYNGKKEDVAFYKHIWGQLKKGTIWFEYGSVPKIFYKEGKPLNGDKCGHFWIKQ